MKNIYFTPGPSQLYPTVKQHIAEALREDIPSISHRSATFRDIVKQTTEDLRSLLGIPTNYRIFFVSSGTEAMERIIQNCVNKRSVHFVNGAFSKRFFTTAKELGKQAEMIEAKPGEGFTFQDTAIPNDAELLCFTHNETAAGTAIPAADIYAVAKQNPQALIAVDTVSSAPYVDLDYTKLDCVFFSVQKGFGLPAGLGIIIVSPRAMDKARKMTEDGKLIGSYHTFPAMEAQAEKYQTVETPNVLTIYLLGRVIRDMTDKGIDVIRKETEEKAMLLYTYFDKHSDMKPFV